MPGDRWNVKLSRTVTGDSPLGTRITVAPGDYTLREMTGMSYALTGADGTVATLRLAELILYRRSGALLIDDWPWH